MAISDSIARFTASLLETLQTRLELFSLETEARLAAYVRYLLCTLIAVVLAGIGILLSLLLVVAYFWDTHRLLSIASLAGGFFLFAALLFTWAKNSLANQPKLFELSSQELAKDVDQLRKLAKQEET